MAWLSFAFALAACCGDAALAGTASHRRRGCRRSGAGTGPVPAPSAEVCRWLGSPRRSIYPKEDPRETARAADAAARLARCAICIDPTPPDRRPAAHRTGAPECCDRLAIYFSSVRTARLLVLFGLIYSSSFRRFVGRSEVQSNTRSDGYIMGQIFIMADDCL